MSPLDRFRAGEIDLRGYLDLKVEEATAHLRDLPAAEMDDIKRTLREKLATDPELVSLVRQATGRVPEPERK